jgi:hypothetical protein
MVVSKKDDTMSSMSNTRKDIAARLGFAAKAKMAVRLSGDDDDETVGMSSSKADIISFFDSHPDVTLLQLSRMTGRDVQDLKQMLMSKDGNSGAKTAFADNDAALSKFLVKYKDNENNNYHSENVVLLANFVGSSSEIAEAKDILKKVRAAGHLPSDLKDEQYSLYKNLAAKLKSKYPGAKFSCPGAKDKFGGMKGLGDWTVGFTDVMKERIGQLKQLAKSLKATVTLGRLSPNGMYSGTVNRRYGPMEPPDLMAPKKVEQLIKSLGGYENDSWRYNARPGVKATMAMKLVKTFPAGSNNLSAKIYRDSDYDSYLVKFFENGKHNPKADYDTEDLQDAVGTAEYSISHYKASRPGVKAKFEISSYEQAEYQIALTEERIVSYRKTLANTEAMIRHANSLMRTADSGDKKAMKEVIGIARMLESTMKSRGFARPGAKTTMAKPPRKYNHGDRVYVMDGNKRVSSGVIDYIFDYDDFVKTYIYKVRDESGGRRSYNETSLKKMSRPGAKAAFAYTPEIKDGMKLLARENKNVDNGSVVKGERYKVADLGNNKFDLIHMAVGSRAAIKNVNASVIQSLIQNRILQ